METIELIGHKNTSKIIFNESIENALKYTENKKTFIITDQNVYKIYKDHFPPGYVFVIGIGESIKTYKTINAIYAELIQNGFDRTSMIVGIGGGLVCDIAGFVSSTFMRGINFAFIPTTLLAMVDASIGGKNGINFGRFKNMVGTFSQPEFILLDYSFLKTLDYSEFSNGIAESIKHALINDPELADILINKSKEIIKQDKKIIEEIIKRSVTVKLNIVEKDEFEEGERKKLNFGHTLGHAVELSNSIPHGKAVSIGMAFASAVSFKSGYIRMDLLKKIKNLLELYKLPVKTDFQVKEVIKIISKDKKKKSDKIDFVLLKSIGEAFIKSMDLDDLKILLNDLC